MDDRAPRRDDPSDDREWRLSRRGLLGVALGVLAVGVAVDQWWRARRAPDVPAEDASQARGAAAEHPLSQAVRSRLEYLKIDDAALAAFVRDYEFHFGPYSSRLRRGRGDVGWPRWSPHVRFLMSTDFFQNGADQTRLLRYVTFYDPYKSPCYQPLVDWS